MKSSACFGTKRVDARNLPIKQLDRKIKEYGTFQGADEVIRILKVRGTI